jgi:hypothetical protein
MIARACMLATVFLLSCLTASAEVDFSTAERLNTYTNDSFARKANPLALANASGEVLVIWEDHRNGTAELYGQLLDSESNPVGGNFNLTGGEAIAEWQYDIASFPNGNFLVAWSSGVGFWQQIKFTILSPLGATILPTQTLENGEGNRGTNFPAVGVLDDATFVIAFIPDDTGDPSVEIQRFTASGNPIAPRVMLDSMDNFNDFAFTDVAVADGGNLLVTYQREIDFRDNNIAAVVLDPDLQVLNTHLVLNPVEGEAYNPSCLSLPDGHFGVFWMDESTDVFVGEVFAQKVLSTGQLDGSAGLVAGYTGSGGSSDRYPRPVRNGEQMAVSLVAEFKGLTTINSDLEGQGTAIFEGYNLAPFAVEGGFASVLGRSVRTNFAVFANTIDVQRGDEILRINDDELSGEELVTEIAMREDGSGLLLWQFDTSGKRIIYGQVLGAGNTLEGDPFVFTTASTGYESIALAEDGSFAIFYVEFRDFNSYFYVNIYDAEGNLMQNTLVRETSGTALISLTNGIIYNPASEDYAVWSRIFGNEATSFNIQRISATGQLAGSLMTIGALEGHSDFYVEARDNGECVIMSMEKESFTVSDVYLTVLNPQYAVSAGPIRMNSVLQAATPSQHRLWLDEAGGAWVRYFYNSSAELPEGVDSRFVVQTIGTGTLPSEEYFLPSLSGIRAQFSYNGKVVLLEKSSDDYSIHRFDPQSGELTEQLIFEEEPLREDFRFIPHGNQLSLIFHEARTPGRSFDLFRFIAEDGDNDGFFTLTDCVDTAPAIFPGAIDLPGNGIDEDCDGADAGSEVFGAVGYFNGWGNTWFGWVNIAALPFVYTYADGWLYASSDGNGGVFLYNLQTEVWMWTSPLFYPWVFSFSDGWFERG